MAVKNTYRRALAVLLLMLFMGFQGSRMLCYHTHIFGRTVISHSHPFNNPDRQHTPQEIASLAAFDALSFDDEIADIRLPMLQLCLIGYVESIYEAVVVNGLHGCLSGRAPPFNQ